MLDTDGAGTFDNDVDFKKLETNEKSTDSERRALGVLCRGEEQKVCKSVSSV